MDKTRRLWAIVALLSSTALLVPGCSSKQSDGPGMFEAIDDVSAIDVTSSAFREGAPLPEKYTCDGEGISPPLSWVGSPPNLESYLVLAVDPDAPGGVFRHWAAYNISSSTSELPEGASSRASEVGFEQAKNDFGDVGYGAACPPPRHEAHEYIFQVVALDVGPLEFDGTPRHGQVVSEARAHILATGTISADYNRE